MLGSKKGARDIQRGVSDIKDGTAELRLARAKTPEAKIEILQEMRDRHLVQAAHFQSKARGVFNGPAQLRAAKASEAEAAKCERRIAKIRKKHDIPEVPEGSVADRLLDLHRLHEAGAITQDEYEKKRAGLAGQL